MSHVQLPWENRIFRVDRECYLLFLGNDEWDIKPFVRIGNSSWLNEEILDLISHTIISESFTGNPLNEVALSQIYKGLYLGEPEIIEVIKSFFISFQSEHSDIVNYDEQDEREGKDLVYFYNDGNIKVTFEDQTIFDLHKREKADRHYNEYCSEIMDIFMKNPLRWKSSEIKGNGFLVTETSSFFFDGDMLLGFQCGTQFFKELAEAGWNPDKLVSFLTTLEPDSFDESESAAFINFLKRGLFTRKELDFISRNESFHSKIAPLFEYIRSKGISLNSSMFSQQGRFNYHNIDCKLNDGSYSFHFSDTVKAEIDENGYMTLQYKNDNYDYKIPTNVPSLIHWKDTEINSLCKEYVVDLSTRLIKISTTKENSELIKELSNITVTLLNLSIDEEINKSIRSFDESHHYIKKMLRKQHNAIDERTALLALNCATLLKSFSVEEYENGKKAHELSDLLMKTFPLPEKQRVGFLFTANYYRQGCFYLPFKLDISVKEKEKANEMRNALVQCNKKEVDFFFSERKRLQELLASLHAGTLWDEMKAHESQNTDSESTAQHNINNQEPTLTKKTSRKKAIQSREKSKGKPRGILYILLLLALLTTVFFGWENIKGLSFSFPKFHFKERSKIEKPIEKVIVIDKPVVPKPFNPNRDIDKLIIDEIQITLADIHLMANQIAVLNGYRDLGFHEVDGKDPTIIEPGLELKVPGFDTHIVVNGDTIWYLGAYYLVEELALDLQAFRKLSSLYEETRLRNENIESIRQEIKDLGIESNCENFRAMIEEWININ